MTKQRNRLVYSTEGTVPDPKNDPPARLHAPDDTLYLRREVKGRGGKTVTTISSTGYSETEIKELAKSLKKFCGSGGSVKSGIIILQGDQRQKITPFLKERGFRVKLAGG